MVFLGKEWEQRAGVRTCVRAELLAADIVSIPSQSEARVLSVRGYTDTPAALFAKARSLTDAARTALMRADLAAAERLLATLDPSPHQGPARTQVETFLRGLR